MRFQLACEVNVRAISRPKRLLPVIPFPRPVPPELGLRSAIVILVPQTFFLHRICTLNLPGPKQKSRLVRGDSNHGLHPTIDSQSNGAYAFGHVSTFCCWRNTSRIISAPQHYQHCLVEYGSYRHLALDIFSKIKINVRKKKLFLLVQIGSVLISASCESFESSR